MSLPEFDQYAKQYDHVLGESIPASLNEDGYFAEYKIALMSARLGSNRPERILDFGCGAGRSLPYLEQYFPDAELFGYDLSPASLEIAAKHTPRATLFSDWGEIADMRFDAIVAANVFHHIPVSKRKEALSQCRMVLADGGQMFLFEHNPFNPMTRWIFDRCPFDSDAEMLRMKSALELIREAGFNSEQHGYTLFFPRQLAYLRNFEPWLKRIPLGAQYYVQMAS
jgi:cyclopropane fatty-acyl-phospholipid synthase-like methyltransferase